MSGAAAEWKQLIVCAAIKNKRTGVIICGVRHFDLLMHAQIEAQNAQGDYIDADQGFVDNRGKFLNRKDSFVVAAKQNQFKENDDAPCVIGTNLYSEDLY